MTSERWREVSRIFATALLCEPPARARYLADACGGDAELRHELESLLANAQATDEQTITPLARSLVGETIGVYAIEAVLGSGGTSQVYRARDTRLGREVALKILPFLATIDAGSVSRFRREAHLLASLNHPNIEQIYGLEEADGMYALVLELVPGPTLADRVAHGPLAVPETLRLARQIVAALQVAHTRGIVHRDLKPSNISVRPDGALKVLDFGLAKTLLDRPVERGDAAVLPSVITEPNMILGTAPYMAPEQLRGKDSDTRSDIWAFGAVLYEMTTGRSPFQGDTFADTVAAVLHREPEWRDVPERLRPLVQRCLQKDPAARLQDIGDARLWLDDVSNPPQPRSRAVSLTAAAALALVVISFAAAAVYLRDAGPKPGELLRFDIGAPQDSAFGAYFLLSPDGRHLAFQQYNRSDRLAIGIHSFQSGASRPLLSAGEVDDASLFWSGDSRFIGFVGTDGSMKRVDITGGPPQTICDIPGDWGGATWNQDNVIVFGQRAGPLMRVSAAGGVPTPITRLRQGDLGHGGPRFLPDGRHFIYSRAAEGGKSALYLGLLDREPDAQPEEPLLVTAARGVFAPSPDPTRGYVLLVSDKVLLAYPFDMRALKIVGDPIPMSENVESLRNGAVSVSSVTASSTGVLAYRSIERPTSVAVSVDRNGREIGRLAGLGSAENATSPPRLSSDGRRAATMIGRDLWVQDLKGDPPIRLTTGGNLGAPLWTPDDRRIVFTDYNAGEVLRSVPADRMAPPEPASPTGGLMAFGWDRQGRLLATQSLKPTDTNIVRFAPSATTHRHQAEWPIETVIGTAAAEGQAGASLSPDGRWLAYSSNVTGQTEVWVQPYDAPGTPVRVSAAGGVLPTWSRTGSELFYIHDNAIFATRMRPGPTLRFTTPMTLFEIRDGDLQWYDVAPNGTFVVLKSTGRGPFSGRLHLVLNWTRLLDKR